MDRSYWRTVPDQRLIEEARSKGCELCIVLGERLEDALEPTSELGDALQRAADAEDHATDMEDRIYNLTRETEQMQATIARMDIEIAQLKDAK